MTNKLVDNLRNYLRDNGIDYLLINTGDEFLLEYNPKEASARYWVTGFTGSTGEALLSKDDLFLFVDGRYHTQADNEVDKNTVTVVKMVLGESFSSAVVEKIKENSTLAIVASKVPLNLYKTLQEKISEKKVEIKLLDKDPTFSVECDTFPSTSGRGSSRRRGTSRTNAGEGLYFLNLPVFKLNRRVSPED